MKQFYTFKCRLRNSPVELRDCLPLSSSPTQWLSASLCWYCALYYKGLNYYCCCYTQRCMSQCLTRSSADADKPARRFRGQSSHQTVAFHMLGIVSSCAIVILSLRHAVFTIFDFKNVVTLKSGSEVTQGHWEWYHSIDCVWFPISVL